MRKRLGALGMFLCISVALGILTLVAAPAQADLIGSVDAQEFFPDLSTPFNTPTPVPIPIGSSIAISGSVFSSIEVDLSSITIQSTCGNITGVPFNGLVFTNIHDSSGDPLTGVSLSMNTVGLLPGDVTFTPSTLDVNFAHTSAAGTAELDLSFGSRPVPEPTSLLLLCSGLLAIGRRVWRKERRA